MSIVVGYGDCGRKEGRTEEWMNGCTRGRTGGSKEGREEGWMNGCMRRRNEEGKRERRK